MIICVNNLWNVLQIFSLLTTKFWSLLALLFAFVLPVAEPLMVLRVVNYILSDVQLPEILLH